MTDRNEQHQNEAEEAAAVETAEAVETEQAEVQAEPTYEDLQARIAELEGQLKDSELRGLANEQNLRRRHQQEIADTHKFAGQKFAAEMLPVKDYLEMALLDQSGNFDALKMGVQMTLNELQKRLMPPILKKSILRQARNLTRITTKPCRQWSASKSRTPSSA